MVRVATILSLLIAGSGFASVLPPNFNDAPLHAVQFVDGREGFAVGDHGIIWHTVDGGTTWERQKSGTRASLRSICFLTPYTGWICGREELPNGAGSSGIVLVTNDGGANWKDVSSNALPGLNYIRFFDEYKGVVCGDGSGAMPSGVFFTADGGKSWVAGVGPRATSYTSASFTTHTTGVVGGVWSKLFTCAEGKLTAAEIDSLGGRAVRCLQPMGKGHVAACDGGVILLSQGGKWTVADVGLAKELSSFVDFRTVCVRGSTIWAMGKPGSFVMRSTDAGKTWQRYSTGWPIPINALTAIDDKTLIAVGELGVVLMSTDAGETWKVNKSNGRSAGVMFAHADGRNLPADLVAMLGQRDGYHVVAMATTCPDHSTADAGRVMEPYRLAAATRLSGGISAESAWAFPVPSYLDGVTPDQLLASWQRIHGDQAEALLVRQMVLAIRMWRPEVIVSDKIGSSHPADQRMLLALQQAFRMADDPKACPEHLEILGLQPFGPKKLYALCTGEHNVVCDQTEFAKHLFDTPQNFSEPAFALLGNTTAPDRRTLRLVSRRLEGSEKHTQIMEGIDLPEGGNSRRKLPRFDGLSDPDLKKQIDEMIAGREKDAKTKRLLLDIMGAQQSNVGQDKAMTMTVDKLKTLPEDIACRTTLAIARQLANKGNWVSARELYLMVLGRYSQYPESVEAARWLAHYYASGEARRRAELDNKLTIEKVTTELPADVQVAGAKLPNWAGNQSAEYRISDSEAVKIWGKACIELETKLVGFGQVYAGDPAIQLSTLAARRQMGLTGDAAKQLQSYFRTYTGLTQLTPGQNHWRDCFAAEQWLLNPASVPQQPKSMAYCPRSADKPFLNGKLDDDCWKLITPVELKNKTGDAAGYSTKVYTSFDDEFLYIGVECKHPEGKNLPKAEKRMRDDDLRGKDRVDILLDLDRDYQSYYRLQVDQRGCVAEDCCGDVTWNPKWFVAVEPTATGWTAELAIPRTELTGSRFATGNSWAWNVTRVVPGQGVQTWHGPAEATPRPECMGLLQFVNTRK